VIGLPSWWATPTLRNFMASSWMLGAIEPSMALHPGSAGEKDALQDRGVRHPRLADVEHSADRPARLKHRKANAADLLGRRGSITAATCAPRASLSPGPRRTALATPCTSPSIDVATRRWARHRRALVPLLRASSWRARHDGAASLTVQRAKAASPL
jgi:hypothetical protein